MCTLVIHHVGKPAYEQTFNLILSYNKKCGQTVWYIKLLTLFCMLKKGYMIPNRKPVYAICLQYLTESKTLDQNLQSVPEALTLTEILDQPEQETNMLLVCVQFAATLFYTSTLEFSIIHGKSLLDTIFTLSVILLLLLILIY